MLHVSKEGDIGTLRVLTPSYNRWKEGLSLATSNVVIIPYPSHCSAKAIQINK